MQCEIYIKAGQLYFSPFFLHFPQVMHQAGLDQHTLRHQQAAVQSLVNHSVNK